MNCQISEKHRKELLRFLLLKTAAVRSGVKPGELLRVQHCYKSRNSEGFNFCLYRADILQTLKLNYLELRVEPESSLILFYHRETMAKTFSEEQNLSLLSTLGYPAGCDMDDLLFFLRERFAVEKIPHEVGVFIGYPLKDVKGFMEKLPRTPVHRGDWTVFGDASESLEKMSLYRKAEAFAGKILDVCEDLQTFFDLITNIEYNRKEIQHG
ncbi:MAG: DUF3793 family protein [Lentisphaeria bacterium]|nr:DUF3793 family protein [Lentisphaeria bacterium]